MWFCLLVNEEFLPDVSITQLSFLGNRLDYNSVCVFLNQLHLFAAKSKDADERKQIQKLQTFYRLYGSTLEGSTSKFIVCQNDVPCSNTAVKKTKQIHVSICKLLFPNLLYIIQKKHFWYLNPRNEILYSECIIVLSWGNLIILHYRWNCLIGKYIFVSGWKYWQIIMF